jgi:hypothetical protein
MFHFQFPMPANIPPILITPTHYPLMRATGLTSQYDITASVPYWEFVSDAVLGRTPNEEQAKQ